VTIYLLHFVINPFEAPILEKGRVQEWPQVIPIVVRTVSLGVITRRQRRHLVPINCIVVKEALHFVRDDFGSVHVLPVVPEALEHAIWTKLLFFAQAPEDAQFSVCHAHISFVGLYIVIGYGLEFGGWCRICGGLRLAVIK